jgi:PAS domain S-box/diguanylate cyclase (GGDEF) domain
MNDKINSSSTEVRVVPIVLNDLQVDISSICKDITEQKEIELTKQEEWFKLTLSSIVDGVIATDREGKIKFMNNAAEELTGYTISEALGQNLGKIFNIEYGETYDNIEKRRNSLFSRIINGEITIKSYENICLISKDNKKYNISISGSPIWNDKQESIGMVVNFQNITERIILEKKFKKMSFYDSLTDVYNRGYFQDVLTEADSEKVTNIGMIVCDLDGLKIINDTLGHCCGDELLVNAACILKKVCRTNCLVARIGGDEFVILLKDCSEKDVEELNLELQNEIEKYNLKNNSIHLSISTGMAFNGCNYRSMKELFKEADNNMYVCKLNRKEKNRNYSGV